MCDSALKQWRKWLSESCQGLQDQGYMFQQKVRCIGKKGNPHLQSATNHNPARADERLVGSPEHTHSCEGCCGHTAGSNGRWGDAIPDNLGCVGRPGRAPEPWKWRHSPLWAAVLDAGKKASVRMASAFNYYSHLWRPPSQSIGPWTPELLHFNTHTGYNSVMVGINTLTRSWETRLAMQRHLSRNGHKVVRGWGSSFISCLPRCSYWSNYQSFKKDQFELRMEKLSLPGLCALHKPGKWPSWFERLGYLPLASSSQCIKLIRSEK